MGLLLLIHGASCAPGSSFQSECFIQDGVLGTLSGSQRFIAMDQHADGRIFGLVDLGGWRPCGRSGKSYNGACESGCLVQEIDSATKTVSSQVTFTDVVSYGVIVKHDATIDALIIGYNIPAESSFDPPIGHRVVAVEL